MAESLKSLAETRPEAVLFAQTLRHRFLSPDQDANKAGLEEARLWLTQSGIRFDTLPDLTGADPVNEIHFRTYVNAAHILARLSARDSKAYPLWGVHKYLVRQEKFAEAHGLVGWLIEIYLARAMMYHVEGNADDARRAIESALKESAPRGYFRLFVDEGGLLRPLLESTLRGLKDRDLIAYVKRLLEAMPGESVDKPKAAAEAVLSEREIEVLRLLADGMSYKEVGEKLFLSLNTVQFHVKSIYRKLTVNNRTLAIEKAREQKLI